MKGLCTTQGIEELGVRDAPVHVGVELAEDVEEVLLRHGHLALLQHALEVQHAQAARPRAVMFLEAAPEVLPVFDQLQDGNRGLGAGVAVMT